MARTTDFPTAHPFYGGIAVQYGAGLHEDYDADTDQCEILKADHINRIELRIEQLEQIVNQMEDEIMYPSGTLASGIDIAIPASGEYYLSSRLDILASGLNRVIELLIDETVINSGDVVGYPFYVGEFEE